MTIQEAIKTGRPFKRLNSAGYWIQHRPGYGKILMVPNFNMTQREPRQFIEACFTDTDILTDDWEVKEP